MQCRGARCMLNGATCCCDAALPEGRRACASDKAQQQQHKQERTAAPECGLAAQGRRAQAMLRHHRAAGLGGGLCTAGRPAMATCDRRCTATRTLAVQSNARAPPQLHQAASDSHSNTSQHATPRTQDKCAASHNATPCAHTHTRSSTAPGAAPHCRNGISRYSA